MIPLDYDLCMAAGKDAGNCNMRKHGRKAWDDDDWNTAAETANKLLNLIDYLLPNKEDSNAPH